MANYLWKSDAICFKHVTLLHVQLMLGVSSLSEAYKVNDMFVPEIITIVYSPVAWWPGNISASQVNCVCRPYSQSYVAMN